MQGQQEVTGYSIADDANNWWKQVLFPQKK